MDSTNRPNQQNGLRGLWFKTRVAFNFKKGKTPIIVQAQTMTQSAPQTQSEPPEATVMLTPQEVSFQDTPTQFPLQQVLIEADTDDQGSSPPSIPIIEVDMTADQITSAILSSTQDISLDPKGEAFKRYQTARAVFEKYGIPFDQNSWEAHPKLQVERIQKAPRMRVRYTCHQCKTIFGHAKICIECTHERCKKCARYPPRRKKSKLLKDSEPAPDVLPVSGGACHECQTAFAIGVIVCENCQHQICERCLEEIVANAEQQPLPELPPTQQASTTQDPIT